MDGLVFISHNRADKKVAREIGLFLASEDINVWFDEWKIPYGESIPAQVNIGLASCTHFVLVWSKYAAEAPWIERELYSVLHRELSRAQGDVSIIPVCLDDTPLPTIIADKLYIRYTIGDEKDRYNIVRAVMGEAPSRNFIEAIVKKYHEVISDTEDFFGLRACPNCGYEDLKREMVTDYEGDENYFLITCKRCKWSDWTQ